MKKAFLYLLFLFALHGKAMDSLKVIVLGDFYKGEKIKFHVPGRTYYVTVSKKSSCATKAWYFYMPLDSSIKDGSLLPIIIEKKTGNKYQDVQLRCYYQADRSYFILWKDRRQNRHYPFIELWTKKPLDMRIIDKQIWSVDYNPKFVPTLINENKYSYFFNNLNRFE